MTKMDTRHKIISASRFVLSSLKPLERISIDTMETSDMGLKYIIVIIDTFTRHVELFPKQEITVIAAADALWRHTCRFTASLELITDFGPQFVNDLLSQFHQQTAIAHHTTIPYSKEENSIVERANKEVNGLIRNILFDMRNVKNGPRCCTQENEYSTIRSNNHWEHRQIHYYLEFSRPNITHPGRGRR